MILDDNNIASYAEDTKPNAMNENTLQVLKEIENNGACVLIGFQLIIFWQTQRNLNFLTSNEKADLNLDDLIVKNTRSEKLLGINIDNFLTFNEHVSKLCKKARQKLHANAHISSF